MQLSVHWYIDLRIYPPLKPVSVHISPTHPSIRARSTDPFLIYPSITFLSNLCADGEDEADAAESHASTQDEVQKGKG